MSSASTTARRQAARRSAQPTSRAWSIRQPSRAAKHRPAVHRSAAAVRPVLDPLHSERGEARTTASETAGGPACEDRRRPHTPSEASHTAQRASTTGSTGAACAAAHDAARAAHTRIYARHRVQRKDLERSERARRAGGRRSSPRGPIRNETARNGHTKGTVTGGATACAPLRRDISLVFKKILLISCR